MNTRKSSKDREQQSPLWQELSHVTHSFAAGVNARELLTLLLCHIKSRTGGQKVMMLTTLSVCKALDLTPATVKRNVNRLHSESQDRQLSLGPGLTLVWDGPDADAIRDWEDAPRPFVSKDGRRLFLPLPGSGIAIEDPVWVLMDQGLDLAQLTLLANLAAGMLRSLSRCAETNQRVEHLEGTRTRLREQTMRLRDLAVIDALTGLYNRRFFDGRLVQELLRVESYGSPLSVVLIDVDHFKQVNDRLGHAQGDALLRALARRARDTLRRGDILCRYGGEEFGLLLPDTDAAGAMVATERVRCAIGQSPFDLTTGPLHVTISAGVSTATGGAPETTPITLIRAADQALYRAKTCGRNCVIQSAMRLEQSNEDTHQQPTTALKDLTTQEH